MESKKNFAPDIVGCSHMVVTSSDVPRIAGFVERFFRMKPHYANADFAEYVLPSGFRLAFFRATGEVTRYFRNEAPREAISIGVTCRRVEELYERAVSVEFRDMGVQVSGPPKDHPWGERSFLLIDPDGNRWEITQAPSEDGMLVPKTWE
jgi:uncharacterized glyoxalase superfamily protein PhnB